VAGGVVMTVFTLVLIGVCTTLMLLGIFMRYVNTSLLPTLEVRAEDYTMSQSSVVYYQDKESGQWVEFQKVHGQENRVLIDIDDMSPYLWQAAVSIEDERFFSHHGVDWKRTLGATLLGTSRTVAAEFSFFMAIPVMLGASGVKFLKALVIDKVSFSGQEWAALIIATVVSFLVSLVVIRFLMNFIKKHDFKPFGWYRIALGALVILLVLLNVIPNVVHA